MNIEITGIVKRFGEPFTKGDFTKTDLVVETQEQFNNIYAIEFTGDKQGLLEFYKPGDKVLVKCNLRGREWTNSEGELKTFISVQGWYIQKAE